MKTQAEQPADAIRRMLAYQDAADDVLSAIGVPTVAGPDVRRSLVQ